MFKLIPKLSQAENTKLEAIHGLTSQALSCQVGNSRLKLLGSCPWRIFTISAVSSDLTDGSLRIYCCKGRKENFVNVSFDSNEMNFGSATEFKCRERNLVVVCLHWQLPETFPSPPGTSPRPPTRRPRRRRPGS